ncbi:Ig-like domain-containing protein [Mesorhizobium sp. CO1-1-4]|uniref:Ig-like domain-containing protein n=1 Tax=Mesorhizobium sp. CO1-1-4 TaxID=2876633 RepID=UPI001CCBE1F4|nr:Ig-like domain-containing protein [Mesorhizobium sp. CO1-1-4]MBZ9740679.1 hypothetical protein [Mesorhizobium sp. CO1-1-4]
MSTTSDLDLLEDGLALSDTELGYLGNIANSGDRAGFYATYYAMTNNLSPDAESGAKEAALQTKIATFSDDVGGVAFFANALLQESLGTAVYSGIYKISEEIAKSAVSYMKFAELEQGAKGGILSTELFFSSAVNVWVSLNEGDHFPGNLLSAGITGGAAGFFKGFADLVALAVDKAASAETLTRGDLLEFVAADGGSEAGFRAAALASFYVGTNTGEYGKHVSDYDGLSGYSTVTSADGRLEYVVNNLTGKTVAVGDLGLGLSQGLSEVMLEFGSALLQAALPLDTTTLALHTALDGLFSDYTPPDADWTKLTESTTFGVYDGDSNSEGQENVYPTGVEHGALHATASSGNDVLFGTDTVLGFGGSDVIDGGLGDDAIFGSGGDDTLSGNEGNDIIYGQDDADTIAGGAGNDVIRGGNGNDLLYAGLVGDPEGAGIYAGNDIGDDIVVGGAGDDTIIAAGGADILIGNTGNDNFYLTVDPEHETPATQIVWGGEGNDSFHFLNGASVLCLYTADISTDLLMNLDASGLIEALGDAVGNYDYVVLNPETNDTFYIGDYAVSSFSVETTSSYGYSGAAPVGNQEIGNYDDGVHGIKSLQAPSLWFTYSASGETHGFADGSGLTGSVGTSQYDSGGQQAFFDDGDYIDTANVFIGGTGYGEGGMELVLAGFTPGVANIDFVGDGVTSHDESHDATYEIDSYQTTSIEYTQDLFDPNYYFYRVIIAEPPTLGALVDETQMSGDGFRLKDDNYGTGNKFTVDLSHYQIDHGTPETPLTILPPPPAPTPLDDLINGSQYADIIHALGGNDVVSAGDGADDVDGGDGDDVLVGGNGNDALSGGDGKDQILGGAGDDTIVGGHGNDLIAGGDGNDSVVWNVGDGSDLIQDDGGTEDSDILYIGAGVLPGDVDVSRHGNDLVIDLDGSAQISVTNQFAGDGIESVSFDGGINWTRDYLEGLVDDGHSWTAADDRFWTGFETSTVVDITANDTIPGGASYNAYLYEQPDHGYVYWNGTGYTYEPDAGFTGVDWFYYGLFDADNNDQNMTPDNPGVAIVHVGQAVDPNDHTGVTGSVGTGNSTYFGGSSFDDTALFTGGNTSFADGKGGDDTMVFSGDVADYRLQGNDDHFWVYNSANSAADVIEITNFEQLKFADTGKIAISDIITAAGHEPGDVWPDSRPINVPHANGSAWVANDDRYWTTAGTAVVLNMTGNDTIPTGAHYNATVWDQPQHGTIGFNGTDYVYTPDTGFTGADWFTYALTDPDNGDQVKTDVPGFGVIHVGQAYDPGNNQGVSMSVGAGGSFGGSRFNDTVNYSAGDGPYIDGKGGDDIIVFNGDIQDYRIQGNGNSFWIYNDSNPSQSETIELTNVEYIQFNGTAALSLSDIIAAANHSPGDFWFDSEPIGGLV